MSSIFDFPFFLLFELIRGKSTYGQRDPLGHWRATPSIKLNFYTWEGRRKGL